MQKHNWEKPHAPQEESDTVYAHKIDASELRRCRINEFGKQQHEEHIRVRNKNVIEEAQKEGNTVHIATLLDFCHLKVPNLKSKSRSTTGVSRHS